MVHVGLDLSRRRIDVCVMSEEGVVREEFGVGADVDGLRGLVARVGREASAVVESMTGARFVHDTLEEAGWVVEVADAQRVKGLAPLTAKTDRIDARVLAGLSQRDLVPAVWLPGPEVRSMRELARFRLHLVKHRTGLKNRVHASLITHGKPVPMSDLFGAGGRRYLSQLGLPQAWEATTAATVEVIDHLDTHIGRYTAMLRATAQQHPQVALLQTAPGVGTVLGYTIACEIGDISRFPTPKKLVGYSGLCPRVDQSGERDRRGPLTRHGPRWLRWALIEAAIWAARHPAYQPRYQRTARRLGKQRGPKVARVEVARRLATAIWWMLTKHEPFQPVVPPPPLVA